MTKNRTVLGVCLVVLSACKSGAPPEPESRGAAAPTPAKAPTPAPTPPPPVLTARPTPPDTPPGMQKPVAEVPVTPGDPVAGKFSLADATAGLPPGNKLVATMKTDKGTLECELYADKAPITVANFVGLARGLRPWKNPAGDWVKKPLYDGTPFHRIIPGFMIQGGDPRGNGSGDPGFVIPDEVWTGAHHDTRGQICMANRGPNTNGSQFFIMDGAAAHLDSGYTIFGKCSPDSVITTIAGTKTQGDRAVDPPKIQSVTIKRVK